MDKLLDKLEKAIERTGMRQHKVVASGELDGVAGADGHGPREAGKFAKPKIANKEGGWGDKDNLVKPRTTTLPRIARGSKSAY